jgi:hypothetical protein
MEKYIKYNISKKLNNASSKYKRVSYSFNIVETTFNNSSYKNTTNLFKNDMYHFIKDIKLEYEIFRKAYINQRKQYKLLRAYLDLLNEKITDDEYDIIEDKCIIEITKYDKDMSNEVIYRFLKNHLEFKEEYNSSEIAELLGIEYKQVKDILKQRKNRD